MNVQEACDYAVQKIVEQGERCTSGRECRYGNSLGQHCAVGWLLDHDDEFVMNYKGTVKSLIMARPHLLLPEVISENLEVFQKLQIFHDCECLHAVITARKDLEALGIDTSKPQWDDWVGMVKSWNA